jgi:hypothetical protein
MARSTPKPPSEIHVLIRISRRRGSMGYDITTEATTDDHGKRITLPSAPDCTFAVNPFPSPGITVTVRPLPTDPPA